MYAYAASMYETAHPMLGRQNLAWYVPGVTCSLYPVRTMPAAICVLLSRYVSQKQELVGAQRTVRRTCQALYIMRSCTTFIYATLMRAGVPLQFPSGSTPELQGYARLPAVNFVELYDFMSGCPTSTTSFAAYSLQVIGGNDKNVGMCWVSGALAVRFWLFSLQHPKLLNT